MRKCKWNYLTIFLVLTDETKTTKGILHTHSAMRREDVGMVYQYSTEV